MQVVRGVAGAHGLTVDINYEWGYPVTVNNAAEADFAAATVTDLFGAERFEWMANPNAGSEDFSYVLQEVPGAYLNLGACPPEIDPETAPMNHSPFARFDDSVVPDGAVLLAELARRRLTRDAS
jgi:metal-dependent amidase/aminoacylase/carboxypeptidase family protein